MQRRIAFALFFLLTATPLLWAQGAEDPEPEARAAQEPASPRFRETVTVVARPLDIPGASVTVIDRGGIEAAGVDSLPELLREVSGLHVSETGSRAGVVTADVRGGDPTFTEVLLDGVLLNDGNDNLGDVYNLAGLSLADLERVEIVRGPASSIYGSRALAGVVHLITRRATEGDPALSGTAEMGSFSQRRVHLAVGGTRGASDGRLSGGWEREAGRVGDDRYEAGTLQLNAGTRLGGREIRLQGRWGRSEGDDYPDASGGPTLGDGALRHGESDELSLGLHFSLGGGTRPNGIDASVRTRALRRESPAIAPVVPASTQDSDLTRLRLGWTGTFTLAPGLLLTTSADLSRETGESDNALSVAPGVTIPGGYEMDRTLGGLFAGLSGERAGFSYGATARLDTAQGHSAQVSPRLSLAWGPQGGHWRVRASGGRGFKLPSFYALGSPPSLGGNPDLLPETSLGGDVGLDVRGDRAEVAVTLFAHRYRDLIDFDFETLQLVNRARVDSHGVELSGSWTPTGALTARASATYLRSDEVGSDATPLHQPRWTGHGSLVWSPLAALRLHLEGYAVSESADQQIPVPDRSTVPGYAWLACGASWQIAGRLAVEGRIDNLTDREYETLIGFPGPARSFRVWLKLSGPGGGR